jgi:ABC-type Fe3+-hydroxamate transport system substrate-binding protein
MYTFDYTAMSARVRVIESSYDWVSSISELREEEQPCKVFVPIWKDPMMTFNKETYIHDLLRVCGGQNIFADRERQYPLDADLGEHEPLSPNSNRIEGRDTRYPRVTREEIEKHQPDVILLPSEPYAFTENDISMFAELDVPATKHNRIHLIDGSLLTWHGTRVAYALNEIPQLMCSDEN